MKFACVKVNDRERSAVLCESDLVLMPNEFGDLVAIIEGGAEARAAAERAIADRSSPRLPAGDAKFLAPIRRFRRDILCTGWNYWDHFEEGVGRREGQEVERPRAPTFFTKGPDVVIGPTDPIAFDPRISGKWDYEAEFAVVMGRTARSVPTSGAMDAVFGYCLANDISQRDLQRRHGGQRLKGKSIDATMPLGPFIVTADEIELAETRLQLLLNGEVRQDAFGRQMAFALRELIAELSFGMTLQPGDIVLTGTPSGVGNARDPQEFLRAGDEVVVRAEGMGESRNRVVAVDLAGRSDVRPF